MAMKAGADPGGGGGLWGISMYDSVKIIVSRLQLALHAEYHIQTCTCLTLEPTVLWVVTGVHGSSSFAWVVTGSSSLVLKTWGSHVMGGVKPA